MASSSNVQSYLVLVMAIMFLTIPSHAQLTADFYDKVCPQALPTIKYVVQRAIYREPRMGASLLRLHFHDCFVNGCDGSLLLDDTPTFIGEKTALPNNGSIRGLDVVDEIKAAVDHACNGPVVSCADILAVAARDSVSILGGPFYSYTVLLGRRDARSASKDAVTSPEGLVAPFFSFSQLLSSFQTHGLDLKDLVALSGAHTIGLAKCTTFRSRIYKDTNIDPNFASYLQGTCPTSGGDDNLTKLDATPARFDNAYYYEALMGKRGVLHSDQELFKGDGGESDTLVQLYSQNPNAFATDFAASMIKMGNMKPLTGNQGEIRLNCRKVN